MKPLTYWLLTAFDGTTNYGSASCLGSNADARRVAEDLAKCTGCKVDGYYQGGTVRTFTIQPPKVRS